jgi:hypothetical protein
MGIRLFILSTLFLTSISINNVHSKNIYLKAELPIYKKYDGTSQIAYGNGSIIGENGI